MEGSLSASRNHVKDASGDRVCQDFVDKDSDHFQWGIMLSA